MPSLRFSVPIILPTILLLVCSCNNSAKKATEDNATQAAINSPTPTTDTTDSVNTMQDNNNRDSIASSNDLDTSSTAQQNNNADSMLSQLKGLDSMFSKKRFRYF